MLVLVGSFFFFHYLTCDLFHKDLATEVQSHCIYVAS
jgi:hypothetical protein